MKKFFLVFPVVVFTVVMASWVFSGQSPKRDNLIAISAKSEATEKAKIVDQSALEQAKQQALAKHSDKKSVNQQAVLENARLKALELEAARKHQEIHESQEKIIIPELEKKEEIDLKISAKPEFIPEIKEETKGALPFGINIEPEASFSTSISGDQPVILTEVLFEDFELPDGWNLDTPPTNWTIIDNGDEYPPNTNNNDWHQYYISSWGNVARIYYSPIENQEEWLISPAINLSPGADQVFLKFKHYYNDYTGDTDTAWVLGSTDGGNTWPVEIARYTTDQGSSTLPDYSELDITSWANNQANVKIAFKYVANNDWYWYVDSVLVETVTLLAHDVMAEDFLAPGDLMIEGYNWNVSSRFKNVGTSIENFNAYYVFSHLYLTPFFSENFESGLPGDWTVIDSLNDGHTWMTGTQHDNQYPGEERSSPWWNGEYMIVDADAPGSDVPDMSEQLLTPWLDCSGQFNIYLYFTHYYYHMSVQFGDVDIRTSQGDNWTNLVHYNATHEGEVTIDISAYADDQDSVQIRWWFHTTAWTWYWGIDNVKLATGSVVTDYTDSRAVSNLESLESIDVVFDDFENPDAGIYTITTYHDLSGDLDRSNDTLASASTCYPHFGTGGPDEGFYSWNDNINGGGPALNWIDISGIGTPIIFDLGSNDDRYTSGIDMGMTFYFYGNIYSRIFISENGFASFDSITLSNYTNYHIPSTSGPENLIALMWDDLSGEVGTAYYYHDLSNNQFIVQFDNWDYYADLDQNIQMQFILDSDDGSIKYQYNDVSPIVYASATVGIENADGDVGLEYVYNDEPLGNITMPGLAITFTYNPPTHDVAATEITWPTGTIIAGDPFWPTVVFSNLGVETETFDVHFTIADYYGFNIYSDVATVTNLVPLDSILIEFTMGIIDDDGVYTCTTYTALATDTNRDNDTLTSIFEVAHHYSEGGPDEFGYRWIDNFVVPPTLEEPPVYDWIDITGDGTLISSWDNGTVDDGWTNPIYMDFPFGFWYYGVTYNSIVITTNAWVSFLPQTNSYFSNYEAGTDHGPYTGIFPGWDDHDGGTVGSVYYRYDPAPDNRFIVSWVNWPYYPDPTNPHDFQIILNGNDNTIIMQFGPTDDLGYQTDVTVGIQDESRTIGLTYYYNGDPALNIPYNGLAIKFYYELYDHDVAVTEFLAPSGWGEVDDPISPEVEVSNLGANDETNVPIHLEITPGIYSEVVYTDVDSGATVNVMFPSFTPTSGGTYTLTAFTALATDEDNSNDTLTMTYYVYDEVVDFEANDGMLTGNGDWEWGQPTTGPESAYSGVNVWATKLDTDYTSGLHTLEFDLEVGATNPVFGFAQWYDTENRYDGGNFAVSIDGGSTWITVSPDRGYDDSTNSANPLHPDSIFTGHNQRFWEVVNFDLSAFAGLIVKARLAFGADGSVFYPGWYVDDFVFTDCGIYLPEHDVELASIDYPDVELILENNTYDIVVTVRNNGSNTETFNVTATDDHSYSNTQQVVGLEPFTTTTVIFPGWSINSNCEPYILAVSTQLPGDENPQNDTRVKDYFAAPPANYSVEYDDGVMTNAVYWPVLDNIIASQFDVPYSNTNISAVAFKFLGENDPYWPWPDATHDTVFAYIFIDDDADGTPDADFIYKDTLIADSTGWTVWAIGCDTTIITDCGSFWAGFSIHSETAAEGLGLDDSTHYPTKRWERVNGTWRLYEGYDGDHMIRAYINADLNTAPDIALGATEITGEAEVGGSDTASTYIDNAGNPGACDLVYSVSVAQNVEPIFRVFGNPDVLSLSMPVKSITISNAKGSYDEPIYPPQTLGSGGPDDYGYTWIDSDEPGGPTYSWIDISTIGTEIYWDNGSVDDGWTNPIPMGMTFNFYGTDYTDIVVSTNGWTSFLPQTNSHLVNDPIPYEDDPNALLAAYWDDLDGGTVGHCYYYHDATENQFIVSWVGWPHYPDPSNPVDFQIILDADDGTILYQYGTGVFEDENTVGIENADGTDGLQVAYNQYYATNNLAVLFEPPVFWLSTDLVDGVLPVGLEPQSFNIYMDATELEAGIYNGAIIISSNDPDEPVVQIDVEFTVAGGGCDYVPGDANGDGNVMGNDVTFSVRYFMGIGVPPPDSCPYDGGWLYSAGDANGNCAYTGTDVTFLVAYFKGYNPEILWCPQTPPAGPAVLSIKKGVTPLVLPKKQD